MPNRLPKPRFASLGAFVFAAAVATIPLVAVPRSLAIGAMDEHTGRPSDGTATGAPPVFTSTDVPKTIPDNDLTGVTSTLTVQGVGVLTDVDLILDNVTHTCVSDLHIELTSPAGTTVVLIAASTENGILAGTSCPDNFIGAVLDDQAVVSLRFTGPPYTNRENIAHESVGVHPLSTFNGEIGEGTWTLRISDRNADDTGVLNGWSLAPTAVLPPVFSSTDVPKVIPDNDPIGVTSTVEVPAGGTIEDLDVILDSIRHSCVQDLQVELTSPAGTTVVLIDADGIFGGTGCGRDFSSTVLNDQATKNLAAGAAPYSGSFNVENVTVVPRPLSRFNGESVRGTWTLRVSDRSIDDTGSLRAWSLRPRLGPSAPCDGDFNQSGAVTVDELVTAVNNALKGCPRQGGTAASTGVPQVFSSSDVPQAIPDFDANGVTSTLTVQGVGVIGDVNLLLDDVVHMCLPDLHIELTSPAGTTVLVVASSIENGILSGLSCPQNFTSTVLDDQAPMSLHDGVAPYTGSFNPTHESVGVRPLAAFNGENADGTWTLRISDRNADDTGSLNGWGLALSAPLPEAIGSMDVPKAIPDNDETGVTSTLELSAPGSIEDLDLIIDDLTHTCLEDLHIELTSPAGTTVVLIKSGNDEGGILSGTSCPDNFVSTVLSDQAAVNLSDGTAPYSGTFNLEHFGIDPMPLAQFNGERASGTWTLAVQDLRPNDTGSLNAWSLRPRLAPVAPCNGDFNGNGRVTVDELVTAVNNALKGCP